MGKTILINQDSLLALKENMVGTSSVSHNTVCVNEAAPEVDEYELGQETDNPPVGGNYCHVEENYDMEVSSSEIDLSSFKKKKELAPVWQDEDTLDSRVRLRLLDIADDFWEFVNLTWVKPSGIILTGSICNFNWSQFSDIDLHLIVDFDEIDEKTEFVRDYLDAKKNEWNNEHNELRLMGFPVELYVQNVGEMPESGGIYDLEDNSWLKRPNSSDIKSIGLDKFSIKDKAAEIMTIIDDMYDTLNDTTDSHEIEQIGDDAHYLWKKVKNMRKKSLEKNGESGAGNIVYKILRRMKYLDKLWKLSTITYDRTNSIQEELSKYKDVIALLKEEVVADGSSEGNPYKKRWKAERDALKNFIANYGKLMQSKEDDKGGKLYKVYFDKTMSDLIGYNYCICVQWDEQQLKPKSTVYIRALDKFTPFIRRNLQYDDRGFDNQRGTYDDMGYSRRTESKKIYVDESKLSLLTESKNSKWAHKKTRELMAQRESESLGRTVSPDDPEIIRRENEFEQYWFREGKRVDWFIVLEPNIYKWEDNGDNASVYVDYIFRKAQTFEKPSQYIAQIRPLETFEQLKSFIDPQMEEDKAAEKESQANMEVNLNPNYQVLGPLSFDEANQYGNYSGLDAGGGGGQICYTQDEDTWLSPNYSDDETNSCYLLLRNDWKEVSTEHDGSEKNNGLPEPLNQYNGYDDYGLSMIFVWITPDGELHESNTRWNHRARYAPGRAVDTAMTEVDIANLMGAPFGKVFNIKTFGERVAYMNEIIDNGESLWDYSVFDEVGEDFGNGSIVRIGKKYNVLSSDGRTFINDKWFDYIKKITSNYARIRIGDKLNVIDFYGDYVWKHPFEEWLDRIGNMDSNGFMDVSLSYGGKTYANLMNLRGEVLINAPIEQWPTMIGDKVCNSFGEFRIVSKFNEASGCYLHHILNSNSNLNDDMWFSSINPTDNFSIVRRDYSGYSEFNILSADASELALDEWVDEVKYIGNNLFKVVTYVNGYDEQENIFDLENRRMVLKEPAKRLHDAPGTIIIAVMDGGKRLYFDKATKQFTNARL